MPAAGDEIGGGRGVGLFEESRHGEDVSPLGQRRADFNIAIAGFRCRRLHAEGDDLAGPGGSGRGLKRDLQRFVVGNGCVGGHHP